MRLRLPKEKWPYPWTYLAIVSPLLIAWAAIMWWAIYGQAGQ